MGIYALLKPAGAEQAGVDHWQAGLTARHAVCVHVHCKGPSWERWTRVECTCLLQQLRGGVAGEERALQGQLRKHSARAPAVDGHAAGQAQHGLQGAAGAARCMRFITPRVLGHIRHPGSSGQARHSKSNRADLLLVFLHKICPGAVHTCARQYARLPARTGEGSAASQDLK